jgi:hypothetical protein
VRAHYIQRVARLSRVGEETLRAEVRPWRRRAQRQRPRDGRDGESAAAAAPGQPEAASSVQRAPREEFLLALLNRHPELLGASSELAEDLFTLGENRELFRRLVAGAAVSEEEPWLWEQHQRIVATLIHVSDTESVKAAFLDCVARLERAKMKAVKEASALALAEGEASLSYGGSSREGRPGDAAAIARAQWEAGTREEAFEDTADSSIEGLASQLLKDTEAGLRMFHRGLIDSSHGNQGPLPTG